MVLAAMGGIGASHLLLRKIRVPRAPSSVAILPKIISGIAQPVNRLLNRQPVNKPGTAAGVKKGKIVSASEKRI